MSYPIDEFNFVHICVNLNWTCKICNIMCSMNKTKDYTEKQQSAYELIRSINPSENSICIKALKVYDTTGGCTELNQERW